jgi:predicted DNA-binding protein YlxM (UPF0122 family)
LVEKNLQISLLLDFYGQMLTEKQREVVEYYYNEDLSLAEIAQHSGITRQGVRDSIKRAELQLLDCEDKLGLMARFHEIQEGLGEIMIVAEEIQKEYGKRAYMAELEQRTQRIIEVAGYLSSKE